MDFEGSRNRATFLVFYAISHCDRKLIEGNRLTLASYGEQQHCHAEMCHLVARAAVRWGTTEEIGGCEMYFYSIRASEWTCMTVAQPKFWFTRKIALKMCERIRIRHSDVAYIYGKRTMAHTTFDSNSSSDSRPYEMPGSNSEWCHWQRFDI